MYVYVCKKTSVVTIYHDETTTRGSRYIFCN